MSFLPAPIEPIRPAVLTKVAPVTRLVVGLAWLAIVVVTVDPVVPARLCVAAVLAIVLGSGLPLRRVPRRLAPLGIAAVGLGILTVLTYSPDPGAASDSVARIGPLSVGLPALAAGLALALRLVVIALTSLLVVAPSDSTRLADSLVQQWHVPERFAFGTLAALRIAPLLAADWNATAAARRLRGRAPSGVRGRAAATGGRLLVLLATAIRRAERTAIAMDARGFDAGVPRSRYRPIQLGWLDLAVLVSGLAIGAAALLVGR